MKILDCYLRALQRAEENLTNGGLTLDKGRFVNLFNDSQIRLVRSILDRKNDDRIRDIQKLVVFDRILEVKGAYVDRALYSLPDDYFAFSNVRMKFRRGDCVAVDFNIHEAKNENVHKLLADEFNKPSFDYRDTFYVIGEDGVNVFVDDFTCEQVKLTYYRYPTNVDISGYIRSDSTQSKDIDPELSDELVDEILNMVQRQFALNKNDIEVYSANQNNVMSPR